MRPKAPKHVARKHMHTFPHLSPLQFGCANYRTYLRNRIIQTVVSGGRPGQGVRAARRGAAQLVDVRTSARARFSRHALPELPSTRQAKRRAC